MKDNFSNHAALYAKYRPGYPPALYDHILQFVRSKDLAWDCGTGNGQAAKVLSEHFKKVVATDISQQQMNNAFVAPNITYAAEPAENTSLADHSVDLITVAQALHWFDFDAFYAEVKRVAKPGAVIAAWTYILLQVSDVIDAIIYELYSGTLEQYWDPERKYVDDQYQYIPFPFEKISTPVFTIHLNWSLADLEGYLNTWSATQKFLKANDYNPVNAVIEKIALNWGAAECRDIILPVYLLLGTIE